MCVRKSAKTAFIRWLAIILAGIAILSCLVLLLQDPVRRCDSVSKYMYNNLALPAPPEWDPAEYPYAYIYYVGETPTLCTLVLVPADAEIVYEDGTSAILFSTPYYKSYSARTVDEQWADDGITQTSGSIYLFKPMISYPEDYIILQWTNFNVYTKDNELIFPKSDPVEVKFDLKSWLTGFALGLAGKPLPLAPASNEPVAYLYNGVRMPPLPDWDKEKYPYACIVEHMNIAKILYCTSVPLYAYFNEESGLLTGVYYPNDEKIPSHEFWLYTNSESWEDKWDVSQRYANGQKPIWSDYDMKKAWISADYKYTVTNDIGLTKSEPVPLYE